MTTTTTEPKAPSVLLREALVEAQRIARGVEKTSTNAFHRYNYAGTESIILEAKDAMSVAGLALVPRGARVFSVGTRMEPADEKNKLPMREAPQFFLAKKWTLVHRGGGELDLEEQVWPVVPEKGRPLDKAFAAADTAALGYLLRSVLMLARVEEGTDLDHPRHGEGGDQGGNGHTEPPKGNGQAAATKQAIKDKASAAAPTSSELIFTYVKSLDGAKTEAELQERIKARPGNLSRDAAKAQEWDATLAKYEGIRSAQIAGEAHDLDDAERAVLERIDRVRKHAQVAPA